MKFINLCFLKDWRPLAESSRVKFSEEGPYLRTLTIIDPMWRDSGIYSCMALNDAGQSVTSCTVTVEGIIHKTIFKEIFERFLNILNFYTYSLIFFFILILCFIIILHIFLIKKI